MGWKAGGANRMLTDFTGARDMYVSLHTAAPTRANELSGNGYARVQFPRNGWTVAAAPVLEGGEQRLKATNTAARAFPTPTGAWGDPTHAAIHPNASSSNDASFTPYADGALGADVDAPQTGATVRFNASDFSLYIVVDAP